MVPCSVFPNPLSYYTQSHNSVLQTRQLLKQSRSPSSYALGDLSLASYIIDLCMMFHFRSVLWGLTATRTVTLFGVQTSTTTTRTEVSLPPATPAPVTSYSVLGTTIVDGVTMTAYGEDDIYHVVFQGEYESVNGSITTIWTPSTLSDPVIEHYEYTVGASAFGYYESDTLPDGAVFPVIIGSCSFGSSTGACTQEVLFDDNNDTSTSTSVWTGSVIPLTTFEVSVSSTATASTSSSTNRAVSVRVRRSIALVASISVVALMI
ncbi:hypothetical protein C8R42DRAFT_11669 [Lentinula raphanica]|nr:hypothetical protein C8R42DRAFT_11669 [Lentinula raphanica]